MISRALTRVEALLPSRLGRCWSLVSGTAVEPDGLGASAWRRVAPILLSACVPSAGGLFRPLGQPA